MITAEEMRRRSEQGYIKRYTQLMQEIEDRIVQAADLGFSSVNIEYEKEYYPKWDKSPASDYLKELTKVGFTYSVSETSESIILTVMW